MFLKYSWNLFLLWGIYREKYLEHQTHILSQHVLIYYIYIRFHLKNEMVAKIETILKVLYYDKRIKEKCFRGK